MPKIVTIGGRKYLYVPKHAWAFSARTCGFLVQFWDREGFLVRSSVTRKPATYYPINGVVWITREYWSNSGRLSLTLYIVEGETLLERCIRDAQDAQSFPGELGVYLGKLILEGHIS